MGGIAAYLKESQQEIGKVLWPNRQELTQLTILVIAVSVFVGGFIGAADFAFSALFQLYLRLR